MTEVTSSRDRTDPGFDAQHPGDPGTGGRLRPPLVVWTTLIVLAAALLPMAISVYQLRSNSDALLDQVQRTHLVATTSVAARADSHLERLIKQAVALANHPTVRAAPQSAASQALLRAALEAEAELAAIAAYNAEGELLVLAQRRDVDGLDDLRAQRPGAGQVGSEQASSSSPVPALSADGRWLRFEEPLEQGAWLLYVAEATSLGTVIASRELGTTARLALVDQAGQVLAGDPGVPASLDEPTLRAATSRNLAGGAGVDRRRSEADQVYGYSPLENAPWFVLSVQPAEAAELARTGIRRATTLGVIGAIVLALAFASLMYGTLVRPLQRVIRTQRQLAGAPDLPLAGSEVDQLESSLALLADRLRDRQDLDEVFLGRYQVLDIAGTGSSSSVFRGWDPKLERPVALKTMRLDRQSPDPAEASARRHRQTDRLLGEAVTHARFVHSNIVTLYDLVDTGKAAFIAMELVDGCSLDPYLKLYAPLATDQILALGKAIASGLAIAHAENLVHQDIKPGNILLGSDGAIKIADFGIAQLTPLAARSDESISGTPGYLAPESLEGRGYTEKADLFALGVVLYEAATGKHPFRSRKRNETLLRTLEASPPRIDVFEPRIPQTLAILVQRLLAKQPEERPESAIAVVAQLEKIAEPDEIQWRPHSLPRRRTTTPSSRINRDFNTQSASSVTTSQASTVQASPPPPPATVEPSTGSKLTDAATTQISPPVKADD